MSEARRASAGGGGILGDRLERAPVRAIDLAAGVRVEPRVGPREEVLDEVLVDRLCVKEHPQDLVLKEFLEDFGRDLG